MFLPGKLAGAKELREVWAAKWRCPAKSLVAFKHVHLPGKSAGVPSGAVQLRNVCLTFRSARQSCDSASWRRHKFVMANYGAKDLRVDLAVLGTRKLWGVRPYAFRLLFS